MIALSKLPKDATTPVSTAMRSVELAHGLWSSRADVLQAYGCDEKRLGANLVIQGTSILSGQCEAEDGKPVFREIAPPSAISTSLVLEDMYPASYL